MCKIFNESVQFGMKKTNQILTSYGIQIIQENNDFAYGEASSENYAIFTVSKKGCIGLRLVFSDYGVEVGINEFHEIDSFSHQELLSSSKRYEKLLVDLLFNCVVIKKCHFGFNFFYVRGSHGALTLVRKLYKGLAAVWFLPLPIHLILYSDVEYHPVYGAD